MTRYYLAYARQHKDDWQALDGDQFAQIRRGWTVASEGSAGLTADEQVNLIFGYLNALDSYLERRGLWADLLTWNGRALTAAQGIGNEALVGGLLNDIGLCHRHLGRYGEAREIFEQALAVRRRVGPVAGEAVTLNNLG
ncbi:MAG: tetratricopeptide repeat protein, partial [Anaerolineae bacterium]